MAKAKSAVRLTVDRARSFLRSHAPKRRRSSGGGGGGTGLMKTTSFGGHSLFEIGSVAIFGGVAIGKFFKLPKWLSPIAAVLILYGWWKKNAVIKSLGILLAGLALVDVLGLPAVIGEKVDQIRSEGIFGMLKSNAEKRPALTPGSRATDPNDAVNRAVGR